MILSTANLITINIEDKIFSFSQGSTLQDILQQLPPRQSPPLAALVNGELQELTYPIYTDSSIKWIDLTDDIGMRIYKRSLYLVLQLAVNNLFPNHSLRIEHSLTNGTYCEIRGDINWSISEKDVTLLQEELERLVKADLPITRQEVSKEDTIRFFKNLGRMEAKIIKYKTGETVKIYQCGSAVDYFYEHLALSTGLLKYFELRHFHNGFILRFPHKSDPTTLPPYYVPKKLANVVYEYERWGELLELENIAQLNKIIENEGLDEMIQIMETMHERKLHNIAENICAKCDDVKLVLIAGPSSSGKTTFAQRLSIQFRVNGIKPLAISLDDYFVNREDTPLDKHGEYDFEHINAINIKLFNEHLVALLAGKEVIIPKFDFKTGTSQPQGRTVKLAPNNILIVEGIHALNEKLTASIPKKNKRKIYVSALTQLNVDNYTPISSSDNRLLRRLCRDMQFRGSSIQDILKRWPSVRRGEERNIFPYQEEADYIFNSALIYELAILKGLVEPELRKVPYTAPEYLEAQRLIRFLQYFIPACSTNVPLNSILKEFIGGSCFVTH